MDIKEIEIPVFLHPHLFWIFWRRDLKKRLQLQNDLAKEYKQFQQVDEDFDVGEVVVVKKDLIWKRAIIEEKVENSSYKYEVWLLDYGHLEHTTTAYKLNPKFDPDDLPPLVHQASLWNVVFLNEDLNIENNSIDHHKNAHPNAGATLNALQFMADYQLFFKKNKDSNGILFGDVMYKKDGETSSLTRALIDKNLMVEDEELFAKVESSRLKDKELYSIALRHASKKQRFSLDLSPLMDEVFMRNASRGISSVNNSHSQSNETKRSTKDLPKSELFRNLRKKSEMRKMELLSCTESEKEENVGEGGRNTPLSMEKQLSRAMRLRNLINRKKSSVKVGKQFHSDVTSGSETNMETSKNSESSVVSELASMKLSSEKINEMEKGRNEGEHSKVSGHVRESKLLKSNNCSFVPEGMRIVCQKKKSGSDTSTSGNKKMLTKPNTNSYNHSDKNSKNIANHEKTYENNASTVRSNLMKKLASRTKYVMSNTSDASDADVMRSEEKNNLYTNLRDVPLKDNITSSVHTISSNTSKEMVENSSNNHESDSKSISSDNTDERSKKRSDQELNNKDTDDSKCIAENAKDSQMVVKPFCNCSQCQFWTTSEDWGIGGKTFDEEEICKRKKVRPPSLMLKEDRKEDIKLASVDYRFMTKIEKKASFKILVHGRLIPQPIDRIVEAPFHTSIHRSLKTLKYIRTKKIQSYVWPAISRSMNVCYIHKNKSGKTLAYLPPICSFLLEKEERYNDLKKGGPLVVILGKSSTECEEIYDLSNKFMEGAGHNKPRITLVSYPFQYVNLSSVDMLITIPPIFIELLKKNATNCRRLCHLVLENIDVLLEKYSEEMITLISAVENMLLQRTTRQFVQMIMNGEHWTVKVEKFVKNLRDVPLVSIGDYLEASIYGGIKLKVKLLEAKAKCDAVVDILRDKWRFHKSIIICNTNEEIELLKTSLSLASISHTPVTDDLSVEQIAQNEINWENNLGGQYIVLICTDQVLHTMLSVTSASLIIHFSLPTKWSFWTKRFYCLLENYKSPLSSSKDKLKCEGYILTDELCVDQIPRLLSLLKNYNVSLQQFEPVCKQLELQKEEIKINNEVPLCLSLKQFGFCHINNCPRRHLLDSELDCNKSLPQNGTIKFKILKLIDVNHLKVIIVEHKDIKGNKTGYKFQKGLDDEKLTAILSQKKTWVERIENGSSYAYWDEEDFNDMFRECIVENIKNDVVDILVKMNGNRTTVSKSKIFQLPEEFSRDNAEESTDVIIANFKPPYKDEHFSARAYFRINRYVEDIGFDDNIFVSNICLQLGDTIWVNTINEEVKVYDLDLTKSNLTKELIRLQLAERNPEHIVNLYSLCEKAGIVLPKYDVPIEEQINREPPQPKPQWAFLEMDFCNKVYFSSAVNPDEIYLRLVKFDSLLRNLEKDLYDVALRQGSKQDFAIIQGRYYLAKDPIEDKFVRVLIRKIEDGKVLCFAVDYGDEFIISLGDIRYLSSYMIQKLPFQAIHCRLFGIRSIEGNWSDEAVDVLYQNFTFEADSDIYRTLYAQCKIYERGLTKGQSLFSILLKDACEKPILINQLLIDCGWADLIPAATLDDFEVLFTEYESEDDILSDNENNDIEKIKEIVETSKSISSSKVVPKSFKSTDSSQCMDENNDLEFFCGSGDEIDNFIDFMTAMTQNGEVESKQPTSDHRDLPAIKAAPFEVDYFSPEVCWSQTKQFVNLHIKLPNVKTYNVKLLKSRMFNFETMVDEKKYVVKFLLYECVEKDFKHTLGGLEVKITLKKIKNEEWPTLSRSKNRLRNVHYFLSKEQMEDDDQEKLFLDLGEDLQIDTDNESDGAFFDVYSDQDSEYGEELAEDVDL